MTKVRQPTEGKCVEVDYKGPVEATVFFFGFFFGLVSTRVLLKQRYFFFGWVLARRRIEKVVK